jgi:O-antigen/teichoic acid export membrane protein
MPGLGGLLGERQFGRAAGLRRELLAITWVFTTAVGATILLWNRSFLTLWVGPENYAGFWTNLLVVIATAQTALVRTDAYVLDATLQPRHRVWVAAVAGVAIVGVSIALTPSLGIVGVCLGVLAGRLVQTIAYPLLVNRCLHRPARLLFRSIARPLTVMLLMFGATAVLGERVLAHHWLGWAAGVALSLALLMPVAFVAGLSAEARATVLGRLRTMVETARG